MSGETEEVSEEDIQINLKKVENGEALTIPLAVLNGVFKKRYFGDKEYLAKIKKENKDKIAKRKHKYYLKNKVKWKKKVKKLKK